MPDDDLLGTFEQLVLLALLRLGEDAYGMTVRREIEDRAGRPTSLGAVYATLDRLEAKGYVSSRSGEPTSERRGRAKRFFKVEPPGMEALRHTTRVIERMPPRVLSSLSFSRWSMRSSFFVRPEAATSSKSISSSSLRRLIRWCTVWKLVSMPPSQRWLT